MMLTAVGNNPAHARLDSGLPDAQLAPLVQAADIEDSGASLQTHTHYPHYDFRACGPGSAIAPTGTPARVSPPLRPRYR